MKRFFYARLAIVNIKKNKTDYIPYLLTCVGAIVMFYNMCFVATANSLGLVSDSDTLRLVLQFGVLVVGIFSVAFLFYTNSFLIKKRKKEFGLFHVLGMEKKHLARILLIETALTGLSVIVIGIPVGILVSKLMILLLFKIVTISVPFGFEVPISAVIVTAVVFAGIFMANLLSNVLAIRLSKPIGLLKGTDAGEREPKTKGLQAIMGVVFLGTGYILALVTESPLDALAVFFIAVVLVIAGTHLLFSAGSIVLLKTMRKNKAYYYKTNHFISVSNMMYRMKQNAAGLANICILSTAVIVMVSTTVSLYVGLEDTLRARYERNIMVSASEITEEMAEVMKDVVKTELTSMGATATNVMEYRYAMVWADRNGSSFVGKDAFQMGRGMSILYVMTQDDYNRMNLTDIALQDDEILIKTYWHDMLEDSVTIENLVFKVKEQLPSKNASGLLGGLTADGYDIVVKDINILHRILKALDPDGKNRAAVSYRYGFDVDIGGHMQITMVERIGKALIQTTPGYAVEGMEESRAGFLSLYGGLFYLGLFLGLMFIGATVLMIYYKQMAEGRDDRERYDIMYKTGLGKEETAKIIKSQVLKMFFLPLVTAVIHITFAFKMITRLLVVFYMTHVQLYALCTLATVIVFAACYTVVYGLTTGTYLRMVSRKEEDRAFST